MRFGSGCSRAACAPITAAAAALFSSLSARRQTPAPGCRPDARQKRSHDCSFSCTSTLHCDLQGGICVRCTPLCVLTPSTAVLRPGRKSTCVRVSSGRFLREPMLGVKIGVFAPAQHEFVCEITTLLLENHFSLNSNQDFLI